MSLQRRASFRRSSSVAAMQAPGAVSDSMAVVARFRCNDASVASGLHSGTCQPEGSPPAASTAIEDGSRQ